MAVINQMIIRLCGGGGAKSIKINYWALYTVVAIDFNIRRDMYEQLSSMLFTLALHQKSVCNVSRLNKLI